MAELVRATKVMFLLRGAETRYQGGVVAPATGASDRAQQQCARVAQIGDVEDTVPQMHVSDQCGAATFEPSVAHMLPCRIHQLPRERGADRPKVIHLATGTGLATGAGTSGSCPQPLDEL